MKICSVYFSVADVDKSIEFYEKLLGIKPYAIDKYKDSEITRWVEFGVEDGMHFALIHDKALETKRMIGNNATLNLSVDDLEAEYQRIKEMGATIIEEIAEPKGNPYYYLSFTITDLDGNLIEIAHY